MYTPTEFDESGLATLHSLIRHNAFATLISVSEGVPVITHLPFILNTTRGAHGTLLAHMAHANPHWKTFTSGKSSLVIFQGPHHYISPSWYGDTVMSVPTWNYTAVHAHGVPRIVDDHAEFLALLNATVTEFESGFENPWTLTLPEQPLKNMMSAIVGLEIPITRLEGKFKLSQNKSPADQANIIEQLRQTNSHDAEAVAQLMEQRLFSG